MADSENVQYEVEKIRQHATDLLVYAQWLSEKGEQLDTLPYSSCYKTFSMYCNVYKDDDYNKLDIVESKKALRKIVRVFGKATKKFNYDSLDVEKEFGSGTVKLQASVNRETVCEKKVVKRTYVKHTSDGYWNEEVEWDCKDPSILA